MCETNSGLPSPASASTIGPGGQPQELVGPVQRRQLLPQRLVLLAAAGQHQDEVAQPLVGGHHVQRAGPVQIAADGVIEVLPVQAIHLHRQDVGQRGLRIASRAETVKAPQHHQPRPLVHRLRQVAQLRFPEGGRIDVAENIDLVLARLEIGRHVAGPGLGTRASSRR